jgi:hypothetical protein
MVAIVDTMLWFIEDPPTCYTFAYTNYDNITDIIT